jgi:hypothetical protein
MWFWAAIKKNYSVLNKFAWGVEILWLPVLVVLLVVYTNGAKD